jgi:hypothetical protein
MVRPVLSGRPGRASRPFVAASQTAPPDAGGRPRGDRRAAPPASVRQAHRQARRRLALHRQPCAQLCRIERMRDLDPVEPVRRYQGETPGELIHTTSRNSAASTASAIASPATAGDKAIDGHATKGWVGSSSMSALTTPPASPSPSQRKTKKQQAPSTFSSGGGLLSKPWCHRRPRHDRQRRVLQGLCLSRRLP